MRAVGVLTFGGPEVLTTVDIPVPEPVGDEVRIRVRGATVNPADFSLRSGRREAELRALCDPPYVPGMEVAGVVDAAGADADPRLVGSRVIAIVVPHERGRGGYADYVVVPASSMAPAPTGWSDIEASTLAMNGLTALLALRSLGLDAGMSLAVTGGAGALGGYVIQLARHLGLEVIADAAASDVALLRELGAQRVIERGSDPAGAIRSVEPDGVDGLVDAAAIGESLLPAIRDGGQLAAVRPMDVVPERGVSLHHIWVPGHARDAESLAEVADLASRGVFTPRVAAVLPPEAAPEAHRRLAAGGTRGRLVLDFGS